MGQLLRFMIGALALAACGSVKEAPDGPDAGVPVDAAGEPGTVVRVSTAGDDSNDGRAKPVKTLKRALGIAASDSKITKIALDSGRYSAASGESFPYTISTDLTIAGPAGGGAILEGSSAGPGLTMARGTLADLELEKFAVAVTATGTTELLGLRIRDSGIAVRGEAGSVVTGQQIDITGTAGACQTGLELNGNAQLTATMLGGRNLGRTLDANGTSNATFTKLSITGDPACRTPSFDISTTGTFAISDGLIDGGTNGFKFTGAATPTQATLTSTIVRNLTGTPGVAITGNTVVMQMTGGELTNNTRAGIEVSGGRWTLTGVTLKQNPVMGIYLQGTSAAPGVLKMRGCTVTGNGDGIYLFDHAQADLGVPGDPGNNTLQANAGQGLDIAGLAGARQIDAVGNTWRPNVQSADAQGKYPTVALLAGGTSGVDGGAASNFSINASWSLRR